MSVGLRLAFCVLLV